MSYDEKYISLKDEHGQERIVDTELCRKAAQNAVQYMIDIEDPEYDPRIGLDILINMTIELLKESGYSHDDIIEIVYQNLNITKH